MNRVISFLLVCAVLLPTNSCKKSNPDNPQVTAVEIHYMEGFSGASYYYLITSAGAFQDTLQHNSDTTYNFNSPLPDAKYQKVNALQNDIPSKLFKENNAKYGEGRIDDGSTVVLIAYTKNATYKWTFQDQIPVSVQPFFKKLSGAIDVLIQ